MIKQTAELFEKLFSVIVVLGYVIIGIITISMLLTEVGIAGIVFGIVATLLWVVQIGAIAMFIMIWKNTTDIAEKLKQSTEAK